MAEADIPAQEPLSKSAVPARISSYEEQLALCESMMTSYDTPLTQAAGYVRDLLRTIIALQQREVPDIDEQTITDLIRDALDEARAHGEPRTYAVMRAIKPYLKREIREEIDPGIVANKLTIAWHTGKPKTMNRDVLTSRLREYEIYQRAEDDQS